MRVDGTNGTVMMPASAERIWTAAQQQLRSMLSEDTFKLWFAPLRAHNMEAECVVLEVGNDFCEVWLKDNYLGLLQEVLTRAAGRPTLVRFKVMPGGATVAAPAHLTQAKSKGAEVAQERASSE